MNAPPYPNVRRRQAVWFLLLVTLIAFWRVAQLDFVNLDDDVYVLNNPHIRNGLTWPGIKWALEADLLFKSFNADYWQPATFFSRMVDIQFFGLEPSMHHLMNLLFHLLNVLLLFHVLWKMTCHEPDRISGCTGRSAMVAALFAVHPLHVESVAWVTERKDVLSGFFWMLTIWAYLKYLSHGSCISNKREAWAWYFLVIFFFALGLMSKPMVITLPFVLLLLDYWPLRRFGCSTNSRLSLKIPHSALFEKVPLMALSLLSIAITFPYQGRLLQTPSLLMKIEDSMVGYATYAVKTIWPHPLAVHYARQPGLLSPGLVLGSLLLLIIISFFSIRWARRFPFLIVGWCWFLGTLVPVIHLEDIRGADRFTYLPLIGLFISAVWGTSHLFSAWKWRRGFLTGLSGVILALFMGVSAYQLKYWRNSIALFEHATQTVGEDALAHRNLALARVQQGKFEEAIQQDLLAIQIEPRAPENHNNLGNALLRLGKKDEAFSQYLIALKWDPDYPEAHYNLGNVLALEGRIEEAASHYQRATQINPDYVLAHYNLAICLAQQNKGEEAIFHLQKALDLQPDFLPAREALTAFRVKNKR